MGGVCIVGFKSKPVINFGANIKSVARSVLHDYFRETGQSCIILLASKN